MPNSESGFTLVEVMAAMALFAVLAGLTTTFIVSAMHTAKQNSDRMLAANVARSQVEDLRAMGTSRIDPGLTVGGAPGTPARFTVRTTANWTSIGQTVSSCTAASNQPNFLRIHVEVSTPDLEYPQVADTLLPPAIETAKSAGVAISVVDQDGAPLSDVSVHATDATNPSNGFDYITGVDGCILVPNRIAPSVLTVTVSRNGYMPSQAGGTVKSVELTPLQVTKPTAFRLAARANIAFTAPGGDYPVPATVPISWRLNDTDAGTSQAAIGSTLTGQWPLPAGFTAWLGSCPEAKPELYGVALTTYLFVPGGQVTVEAASAPVLVRGLPADAAVTVEYAGTDGTCSPTSFAAGRTDAQGRLQIALPYGPWRFTGGGETHTLTSPLRPDADGGRASAVRVDFTVADLDHMSPTPSASASASGSGSPSPTGTPSPTVSPTP